MKPIGHRDALVLAGAVAQGAFEAGALEVLVEAGVRFGRVVAASSGGLNATVLASGLRSGAEREAVHRLTALWEAHGDLAGVVTFNPLTLLKGQGLSSGRKLRALLEANVRPTAAERRFPLELSFVVGALQGVRGAIGRVPATTFEGVARFSGEALDTQEGLSRIFNAAVASAAFPGLFTPVRVEGLGECVDGGIVNNTPLAYALEGGEVSRVFLVAPYPAEHGLTRAPRGLGLLADLVDMLIQERLYRDLRVAEDVNATLRGLEALEREGVLSAELHARVLEVLPWPRPRPVQVVTVRPRERLPGNAFSGFFSRPLRQKLLAAGREAASRALESVRAEVVRF